VQKQFFSVRKSIQMTAHDKARENNVEMNIATRSDSLERAQYFSGLYTLDGMDAFRSARVLGDYKRRTG